MEFSVDVDSVSFIIDADSEEEAIAYVEDALANIAVDWAEPNVY